jgi:hypothetical protein
VLGSRGVLISIFGSTVGFVTIAAGERCIVANVAAAASESFFAFVLTYACCLREVGEKGDVAREKAGDREAEVRVRSGVPSCADRCRSGTETDDLPNAHLDNITHLYLRSWKEGVSNGLKSFDV